MQTKSMKNKNFAVLILTYWRAEKVFTVATLRRLWYTGKIYLVCSTDDKQLDKYKEIYWDDVITFNKDDYADSFDIGDNFWGKNVVVFARNAAFDIAKNLWLEYFLELDDDYTEFQYKIPLLRISKLQASSVKDIYKVFDLFIDFLKSTPVTSIAFAQGWDFMWWVGNNFWNDWYVSKKRKLMNCFFNKTDRPYKFHGRINEDVCAYINNGKTWDIYLTHPNISMNQPMTQTNSGGLTEIYKEGWTYIKSFYTVLFNPSAVSIMTMWPTNKRIHHRIEWKHAVPVIIPERFKK